MYICIGNKDKRNVSMKGSSNLLQSQNILKRFFYLILKVTFV